MACRAIGLNRKALTQVVLCDYQERHDGKIVGPEVGLAEPSSGSVPVVFGAAAFEPDRLVGAIAVGGAVRQNATNAVVVPDAVCIVLRPGQPDVWVLLVTAQRDTVEADELRPDLGVFPAVWVGKRCTGCFQCGKQFCEVVADAVEGGGIDDLWAVPVVGVSHGGVCLAFAVDWLCFVQKHALALAHASEG